MSPVSFWRRLSEHWPPRVYSGGSTPSDCLLLRTKPPSQLWTILGKPGSFARFSSPHSLTRQLCCTRIRSNLPVRARLWLAGPVTIDRGWEIQDPRVLGSHEFWEELYEEVFAQGS